MPKPRLVKPLIGTAQPLGNFHDIRSWITPVPFPSVLMSNGTLHESAALSKDTGIKDMKRIYDGKKKDDEDDGR
eukprot:3300963-Pyramimonas_sp.AAC.1